MKTISLVSSKSIDNIDNKTTNSFYKIEGGPYKFISTALEQLNLKYKSHLGATIEVDIVVNQHGETGSIKTLPPTKYIPKKLNQVSIISTVYNEWSIDKKLPCSEIFLDIQGFVRTNNGRQKKKLTNQKTIFSNFFCIKGNKEEIDCIPKKVVSQQKKLGILIITNGINGIDLYNKGKHTHFDISQVKTRDTVGAGDTFFGFVVGNYILNNGDIKAAIQSAIVETSRFIEKKG